MGQENNVELRVKFIISIFSTFKSEKAFVPVHFYGQLVRQEEGCVLLKEEVIFSIVLYFHYSSICSLFIHLCCPFIRVTLKSC